MAGDIRGLVDVASISSCPGRPSRVLVSRAGFRFSPLVPLFMPTLKSVPSRWPSFRTWASLFLQPGCLALGEKVKLPSTASSMWKRSVLAKVTLLQAQLVPGDGCTPCFESFFSILKRRRPELRMDDEIVCGEEWTVGQWRRDAHRVYI
jgi:hypothetical protein